MLQTEGIVELLQAPLPFACWQHSAFALAGLALCSASVVFVAAESAVEVLLALPCLRVAEDYSEVR